MKKNWEIKTLKEITSLLGDGLHGTPKYTIDGDYYFINGNNLDDGKIIFKEKTKKVSFEEYDKYKKNLNDRTVFVSINGTLGNIAFYNNEKVILGKSACYFNLLDNIDKNFIKYFLQSPYVNNYLHTGATGATIKNVSLKSMRCLQIPLPNELEEQKQIVEILDKTFESIEKAKENIEKNIQNSKELFASRLNEIFSQKGDGWEEKKLSTVFKTGAGGTPLKSKKEYYENGTIPWLCSGEVKQGNIYKSTKLISQKGLDNSSAKLFPENTVVIAMYGATAGDVGILRFETSTNQAVCGILPNNDFLPEFIYYSFLYRKKELISQATGNAQPNISQIKIKNTLIPIIDKLLQIKIVDELDNLKEQTKQLENQYQQKLDNLEELKKSILEKAFSGELLK